jgi:hypothetical protein
MSGADSSAARASARLAGKPSPDQLWLTEADLGSERCGIQRFVSLSSVSGPSLYLQATHPAELLLIVCNQCQPRRHGVGGDPKIDDDDDEV